MAGSACREPRTARPALIVALPEGRAKASLAMSSRSGEPHGSNGSSHNDVLRSLGRLDTDLYGDLRDCIGEQVSQKTVREVGDAAPDFFLPDETARLVSLTGILANGPVVLTFIGGSWSSFCLAKVRALTQAVRGRATMVAITPETGSYPRTMKVQSGLEDCAVLCDVDYGVGLQFGLIFAVRPSLVEKMAARGLDLLAMHGVTKPMLPAPAVYVVASSGHITYLKLDLDYMTPAEPGPVLQALGAL
jgi:peroxiredoxin